MRIGYVMAPGRGETDRLLSQLADRLARRGMRLVGVVQTNIERADRRGCDMDVRVLPGRDVIRISQALGPEARGCRLDPSALETAVARVQAGLGSGCDLLVINKFGKHEAGGRGFREVMASALLQDIPVIVGLNAANLAAFEAFTDGAADCLGHDFKRIEQWVLATWRAGAA